MKSLIKILILIFPVLSFAETTTFVCSGINYHVKQNELSAFEQTEFSDVSMLFTNAELASKDMEVCRTISGKHECLNKITLHYQSKASLVGHITEIGDGTCQKK